MKNNPQVINNSILNVNFGVNVKIVEPVNLYGCNLGDNVFIGPFVEIQKNVTIGKNTKIQSHSFVCELVEIGDNCFIGHGVVFINETVPNKIVAWVANKLYKEHYIAIPTKHNWTILNDKKEVEYQWKVKSKWNSISVVASATKHKMEGGSAEEFIFEHYFGYTKVNSEHSIEYKINHPSWEINEIHDYQIDCNFEAFYGKDFDVLNSTKPHSIMLAEGSDIRVDWKRISF